MKTSSIVSVLFSAILFCLITSGCKHTANGAGQDMQKMGEKIQDKTQ